MIRENVPKESGIYQIRNLISGRRYVGSAKSLVRRASAHTSKLELSDICGLPKTTIRARMLKGHSVEASVDTPSLKALK